jgi:hypothetical protein
MTGIDGSALFPGPARPASTDAFVDAARQSPLEWVKGRRAAREQRRAEQAHQRTAHNLAALGPDWKVVDLQRLAGTERMSYLALGPGGVFAVTVKNHGRSKVMFAGDVVQIDGKRPKYVQGARENARIAAEGLSRVAGVSVPVMPVLAFAGSGLITFYGLPKGCIVSAYQELSRVLNARGQRLAPRTVDKLFALASQSDTWINAPYVALADRFSWDKADAGETAADKRAARR